MEVNENKHQIKKGVSITTLFGIFLILIALAGFLSASPGINNNFKVFTYIFAYPVLYVFGFVGYWIFYPGLLIYGLIILFRNRLFPLKINLSLFGYVLLVIFVSIGFTQIICMVQSEPITLSFQNCVGKFNEFFSNSTSFMFNSQLGGGVIGFFFAGLLNDIGTWLLWTVVAVGIFISLLLVFKNQIKALFYKIRDAHASKKESKDQLKDASNNIEQSDGIAVQNTLSNNGQDSFVKSEETMNNVSSLGDTDNQEQTAIDESSFNFQIKSFNKTHGLSKATFYLDNDPNKPTESNSPADNPFYQPKESRTENKPQHVDIVEETDPIINEPIDNEIPNSTPINETPIIENKVSNEKELKNIKDNDTIPDVAPIPSKKTKKDFVYPPLDLLNQPDDSDTIAKNEKSCLECEQKINAILNTFKIGAQIVGHTIGPSVTRYDLECKDDTSVNSITKYENDISIRLGGIPLRFEPLVLGKATSGLEIANKESSTVSLRECIEALPKRSTKSCLDICFGKDISSDYQICSIKKFPHMLVAGTTGSGKSIFMHSMIVTLLMRNSPSDVRIVLIDPKRVEMSKYRDVPQLLCPVINDANKAKVALKKLCDEMNNRYSLFEAKFVSDIDQYNEVMVAENTPKLPYIICFIDEYADLSETCKDIGSYVTMLGQKSRACGIHLVVATQRPSVNVISGTIKANLTTRVALAVSSAVDSQTIIDQGGAEDLLGYGDMLISCTSLSRGYLVRCQGSYVSNGEILKVVTYLKKQTPVEYDPEFLDLEDHSNDKETVDSQDMASGMKSGADDEESFYITLRSNVMLRDYVSMSLIQRDFSVGFNRAGRLMNRLRDEGVVSRDSDGSKGSRVLIKSMEELNALNESKNNNSNDENGENN